VIDGDHCCELMIIMMMTMRTRRYIIINEPTNQSMRCQQINNAIRGTVVQAHEQVYASKEATGHNSFELMIEDSKIARYDLVLQHGTSWNIDARAVVGNNDDCTLE
jgi:hypothetical protein